MNKLDKNYLNLLRDILENGSNKEDRTGTALKKGIKIVPYTFEF